MSVSDKVVWAEGMFLRHQHFQQQERYFENYIDEKTTLFSAHAWGLSSLAIDQQHLALGRISVNQAKGIFPDGTPFDTERNAFISQILQLAPTTTGLIYLALPLQIMGSQQVILSQTEDPLQRYHIVEESITDSVDAQSGSAVILLSKLKLQLLLEKDDHSQYAAIPIARILEVHEDGTIALDPNYIPPSLNCQMNLKLNGYIRELYGMLRFRGEELASRVARPSVQMVGSIQDFLLLQLINRYELLIEHFSRKKKLHPETLYEELLKLAGELAVFTHPEKRLSSVVTYRHDDLQMVFQELMTVLRQLLAMVLDKSVVPLKVQESKQGIKIALITDRSLFDNSDWIVAVKAGMGVDLLRSRFLAQAKIGPVEKIRDLIASQLPGIKLESLPVAPPEVPYHPGFLYFRLDKGSPFFQQMRESAGFAFYLSPDIPDPLLECWVIRR